MSGNIKYIGENNSTPTQLPTSGFGFSISNSDGKDNALKKFASSFTDNKTKQSMATDFSPQLVQNITENATNVPKLEEVLQVKQTPLNDKDCSVYTISKKLKNKPGVLDEEEISRIKTKNETLKQENDILEATLSALKNSYEVERNAFSDIAASLSIPSAISRNENEEEDINPIVEKNTNLNNLNNENTILKNKLRYFEEQQQERKQTGEASTSTDELEDISKVVQEPQHSIRVSDPRTTTKEHKKQLLKAQEDYKLLFTTLYPDSMINAISDSEIEGEIEKLKNEAKTRILRAAIAYDTSVKSNNPSERTQNRAASANRLSKSVTDLVERYKLAFPRNSNTPKFGGKSRRRSKRRSCTRKKTKTRRYRKRSFTRRRK